MISALLANKRHFIQHISALFTKMDKDGSGYITIEEFEERFMDPHVQAYFSSLDLNPEDAWEFFKLLDADHGGILDIEEFVDGCMRVRGPAKSIDIARMMHQQKRMVKVIAEIAGAVMPHCNGGESHNRRSMENHIR